MGKRIMNRRRGRGFRYRATDNRFKGKVRHPRAKSSSGVVQKLLHDPGRSAPVAQVRDGDGDYMMLAHDGMRVGQSVDAGHGAEGRILPFAEAALSVEVAEELVGPVDEMNDHAYFHLLDAFVASAMREKDSLRPPSR